MVDFKDICGELMYKLWLSYNKHQRDCTWVEYLEKFTEEMLDTIGIEQSKSLNEEDFFEE